MRYPDALRELSCRDAEPLQWLTVRRPFSSNLPRSNCRSEPARDEDLSGDKPLPYVPRSNCGNWFAGDGALTAHDYFPDAPGSTVGASLPAIAVRTAEDFLRGVHIRLFGHGGYWFRFYSESLGGAPSNQTLLPLSYGASPRLGIPSLRPCSVGPLRSAIHGRAQLTRHPCRVAHCAEPALGLPRGQEDQNQKQIKSQSEAAFKPT